MPIISVVLAEGRSDELKREFIRAITEATVETLSVRPEQIRVIINETPLRHYAIGGRTFAEIIQGSAEDNPEEAVR